MLLLSLYYGNYNYTNKNIIYSIIILIISIITFIFPIKIKSQTITKNKQIIPSPPGPPHPKPPGPPHPKPPPPPSIDKPLVDALNNLSESQNEYCASSFEYPNYNLPKTTDNGGVNSNNYPVNFNVGNLSKLSSSNLNSPSSSPAPFDTNSLNIFMLNDPTQMNNLKKIIDGDTRLACNFKYDSGGSKSCNIGSYNWSPITILITKAGTYDFGNIHQNLQRYFTSIIGLTDDIIIQNLDLGGGNDGADWADAIQNKFFFMIQNCTIDNPGGQFNFGTSQGTSLIRCKVNSTINLGSGSPGYMRNTILRGPRGPGNSVTGNGAADPQQYLFNQCEIEAPIKRYTCPDATFYDPHCQYIYGLLNCTGKGTGKGTYADNTGSSCSNNNKNISSPKYGKDVTTPVQNQYEAPNVNYKDLSIVNEEFISVDSQGVFSFTTVSKDDVTKPDSIKRYKMIILDQNNINNIELTGDDYCYILPGGRYFLTKPLVIPKGCILYGLGFVNLVPIWNNSNTSSNKFIVKLDGGYICNCIIDSPPPSSTGNGDDTKYEYILYITNNSKVYNTHLRILTFGNNLNYNSSSSTMMYVEGNSNYIEHSWIWLGDHWGCNNSCGDGNCPSAPETTGLCVDGESNTFVGMFVEHQQHPIIINGNKNKIIWVQGEGAYKNMPTTTSYISIDNKVQHLTFVMAGIYSIAQQTIAGINFDGDGWKDKIDTYPRTDISVVKNIYIRDILVTGWNGSGTPWPVIENGNTSTAPQSGGPQWIYYICNITKCNNSSECEN